MRRPRFWWRGLILISTLLILLQYITLTWLLPWYLIQWVRQKTGGAIHVTDARLSLPFTTTLLGVSAITNTPDVAFNIERAVLRPRWATIPTPQVYIQLMSMTRPYLRLTRDASGRWWPGTSSSYGNTSTSQMVQHRIWSSLIERLPSHGLHIQSIQVTDGTIELTDRTMTPAFHALVDHLSVTGGPVNIPGGADYISFAVRGELTSEKGASAPFYCSGGVGTKKDDLDISCRLEPLELDVFEPYYQGSVLMRISSAILEGTTRWMAKGNELNARIQMSLTRLRSGALTVRGRNLLDPKYVGPGKVTSLRGELRLTGPLHQPKEWLLELVPGNEPLQQVVNRLLDLGIERVTLKWLGRRIGINLIPGSKATISDIAASGKQIEDALEALVLPSVEESMPQTPAQPQPSPTPSPSVPAQTPPAPESSTAAPETPSASVEPSNVQPVEPPAPSSTPSSKQ